MVMVEFATFALLPRERFRVTLPPPGAATRLAVQVPVIPAGNVEAENVIAELNPASAAVVTVRLPFPAGGSVTELALTARVNPETFTVTVAVRATPLPLALTVSV